MAPQVLSALAMVDLLIHDDWVWLPLPTSSAGGDPLEIFDDRHSTRSTLVTCQVPVEHWHEMSTDASL